MKINNSYEVAYNSYRNNELLEPVNKDLPKQLSTILAPIPPRESDDDTDGLPTPPEQSVQDPRYIGTFLLYKGLGMLNKMEEIPWQMHYKLMPIPKELIYSNGHTMEPGTCTDEIVLVPNRTTIARVFKPSEEVTLLSEIVARLVTVFGIPLSMLCKESNLKPFNYDIDEKALENDPVTATEGMLTNVFPRQKPGDLNALSGPIYLEEAIDEFLHQNTLYVFDTENPRIQEIKKLMLEQPQRYINTIDNMVHRYTNALRSIRDI